MAVKTKQLTSLHQDMNIAVPASDLDKIHTRSVGVPGEPGMYVAGLSVYHELHCLVSCGIDTVSCLVTN
jgi:hypothetical protein